MHEVFVSVSFYGLKKEVVRRRVNLVGLFHHWFFGIIKHLIMGFMTPPRSFIYLYSEFACLSNKDLHFISKGLPDLGKSFP
jgi:hypothetical protein